jgi:hypothetical protein
LTFLSFLPPSHAYEHTAGQYLPIGLGGEIYYAEGLEKLAANIEEVGPSIMVVVPRLFEVLRQRMLKTIEKQGGLGVKLLAQAERLGRKSYETGRVGLFDKPVDFLVERTLRKKVRQRMGGRLKAMVSGGAPLDPRRAYRYRVDSGAEPVDGVAEGTLVFSGASLLSLAREELVDAQSLADARRLLRAALDQCLDGRPLRTREVMLAMRSHSGHAPGG